MNKSLIAVAVAAAVPAIAQAQTNVTLSGFFKTGLAQTRFTDGATGNGNAVAVADGASRFVISGSEDLGQGLKAIFLLDNRFRVDDNNGSTGPIGTGAVFVGLEGGFGRIRTGKLDLYYNVGTDEFPSRAVAIQHSNISLLSYVGGSSGGIAKVSRSANVIRYDSPKFGGVQAGLYWSPASSAGGQSGMTTAAPSEGAPGASKGQAWGGDVNYSSGATALGAAIWDDKPEGASAGPGQKAWRVFGSYNFGVAKIGLLYDESTLRSSTADTKRGAWSIPVTAKIGPGVLLFTYTQAQDKKTGGSTVANTGARQIAIGYDYPLSKRTSLGASYSTISNESAANYGFYNAGLSNLPSTVNGQDVRQLYVGMRHAF